MPFDKAYIKDEQATKVFTGINGIIEDLENVYAAMVAYDEACTDRQWAHSLATIRDLLLSLRDDVSQYRNSTKATS